MQIDANVSSSFYTNLTPHRTSKVSETSTVAIGLQQKSKQKPIPSFPTWTRAGSSCHFQGVTEAARKTAIARVKKADLGRRQHQARIPIACGQSVFQFHYLLQRNRTDSKSMTFAAASGSPSTWTSFAPLWLPARPMQSENANGK